MSRPWERSVARADRCKKRFLKQSEGRGEGKMSRKQARYRMGPRDSSREQVKRGIKLAWSSSPGPPQGVQSRWHVYHARSRVSCHALHVLGVALESASFVRFHVTGDTMPRYVPLCFLISISSSRPSSRGLVPSTNAAFPRSVRISSAIVKPGDVRPVSSIGDLLNPPIKIVLGRGDRSFVIIATNKSRQLRNLGLERGPGFL